MEYISRMISKSFCKLGYIEANQIEDLRYGLEVVISNAITLLSILVFGIAIHRFTETMIFFSIFIVSRSLRDRYHAKTFMSCFIMTFGTYLLALVLSYVIAAEVQMYWGIYLVLLNCLIVYYTNVLGNDDPEKHSDKFDYFFYVLNCVLLLTSIFAPSQLTVFSSVVTLVIASTSYFNVEMINENA